MLIILSLSARYFYRYFSTADPLYAPQLSDFPTTKPESRSGSYASSYPQSTRDYSNTSSANKASGFRKIEAHPFDPNTASESELTDMGMRPKLAQTIIHYREKGGKFRTAEDLRKIYGMHEDELQALLPFARITEDIKPGHSQMAIHQPYASLERTPVMSEHTPVAPKVQIVEINAADSEALVSIRGIGPAFAKRIMQYRKKLGGFQKKEQLMEIFGIDPDRYEELKDQMTVNARLIHPININTATEDQLRTHPYIRWKSAKAIINYRAQHGNYTDLDQLREIQSIDYEAYQKMLPYLDIE